MGEMIKMVVVLTILSVISGTSLAYLEKTLKPIQDQQIMEKVKGPTVRQMLKDATNDPIADVLTFGEGKNAKNFFYGVYEDKPKVVLVEAEGKGYGGPVGLLVGIDLEQEVLDAVAVTTHTETGGLGAEAKDDPTWAQQFKDKPLDQELKVTSDGGDINAISGATITSRAVTGAVNDAIATYKELKPQLTEKLQGITK